jgi:hypothetical protein
MRKKLLLIVMLALAVATGFGMGFMVPRVSTWSSSQTSSGAQPAGIRIEESKLGQEMLSLFGHTAVVYKSRVVM